MKKEFILTCLMSILFISAANAQFRFRFAPRLGGYGNRQRGYNNSREPKRTSNPYKPSVSFSLGYSYPNLDKQLFNGSNFYTSNINQTNYINASIDYKYSLNSSIGLFVTYGKTNTSFYYDVSKSNLFANSSLSSWSILLNYKSYLIESEIQKLEPYIRAAVGVNIWEQKNTDDAGNTLNNFINTPDLAYQVSLGTDLNITKKAAVFIEAGYGKYIVNGGVKLKL